MRKIVSGAGTLLILLALSACAQASIVVTRSDSTGATINGGSITRTVTFDAAQFTGGSDAILDIEVAISFSKLNIPGLAPPFYNEITLTLGGLPGSEIPSARLLIPGTPFGGGTFLRGNFDDPGFDGILRFKHSATVAVNNVPFPGDPFRGYDNEIPKTGGPYLPDPRSSLAGFMNASGAQTFQLTIGNTSDDGTGPGSTPLVYRGFEVSITAVPEPGALACLGLIATAGAFVRRRRA